MQHVIVIMMCRYYLVTRMYLFLMMMHNHDVALLGNLFVSLLLKSML